MNVNPFGIDVSRYQGAIDWEKAAAGKPKVLFCGIRATVSWGYKDGWFKTNWESSKQQGIFRTAYHVVYPGESVIRQMDNFLLTVGDDLGELPLVLDCELDHGLNPAKISNAILNFSEALVGRTGKRPMIYSRANWIDTYVKGIGIPPVWLNNHYWWLAHYRSDGLEFDEQPPLPQGVGRDKCLIHQSGTKGDGKYFGMESFGLDINRWQFDETHLFRFVGANPPAELTLEGKVNKLWAAHPELHGG